jgi:DNA adenine methylase
MFLYLNRHCYNGLCRYNLSGGYNVPFGRYVKPYFPEHELEFFVEKAQKATFICKNYTHVFNKSKTGDVIYCDPPYVPLSKTASFTAYAKDGFNLTDQKKLAKLARKSANNKQVSVVISNHATDFTKEIYATADETDTIDVARTISHKGGARKRVEEIFALYKHEA